jgi:catechol 2,3-dioxygenase-like lactoylglutathione lyase family enzyme
MLRDRNCPARGQRGKGALGAFPSANLTHVEARSWLQSAGNYRADIDCALLASRRHHSFMLAAREEHMSPQATVTLDHLSVPVRRFNAARKFYEAALGAIGMKVNMELSDACGLGAKKEKIFWIVRDRKAGGHGHYALRVPRRRDVDAFHAAALRAGGSDNGGPGPRPDYGPNCYAAFVKDEEDNNIEVVCYERASASSRRAPRRRTRTKRDRAQSHRV